MTRRAEIIQDVKRSLPDEPELRHGIDAAAIADELISRFGYDCMAAVDEDGDPVIDHDTYWEIVRRHDSTQHECA